jgi:DNA-binding PadR family transcriptional regulator
MVDRPRSIDHLLPLSGNIFYLLLALADGPRHGYGLMQDVRALSEGKVRLWPTRLYGALRDLEKQGLISETARRPAPSEDDERRRYFALTPLGRRVLHGEAGRLRALSDVARATRQLRKSRA